MKNFSNEKGVTLIILLITVIILIILAGVTISNLTGEKSVINKAEDVTTMYNQKAEETQSEINNLIANIDSDRKGVTSEQEVLFNEITY